MLLLLPLNSSKISDRDIQIVVNHPVEDIVSRQVPGLPVSQEEEVGDDGGEAGHYREDGDHLDSADLCDQVLPHSAQSPDHLHVVTLCSLGPHRPAGWEE